MYDVIDSLSYTQCCREIAILRERHGQLMEMHGDLLDPRVDLRDDIDSDKIADLMREYGEALREREIAVGRYERGEPVGDDENAAYVGRMWPERRAMR